MDAAPSRPPRPRQRKQQRHTICRRAGGAVVALVAAPWAAQAAWSSLGPAGALAGGSAGPPSPAGSRLLPPRSSRGHRVSVQRAAEGGFQAFSTDRLRAETDDPFGNFRVYFFGGLTVLALVGLVFLIPKCIAVAMGVNKTATLASVGQDTLINIVAAATCAFVTANDWKAGEMREVMRNEGALIARLPVWLQYTKEGIRSPISELRESKGGPAKRVILCLGDLEYCKAAIESSAKLGDAMERCDFLLVPVVASAAEDSSALAAVATGKRYIALPSGESASWDQFIQMQLQKVREQGMDEACGQCVIIRKNGRVATRFLGIPDFAAITSEVAARVNAGLDTVNI